MRATQMDFTLADRFNRVLNEVAETMEESGVRYAFIGGVASGGLGRPRSTRDIDVFVRPEDAETVLHYLAKRAFRTEKTDPSWLYKAFKEGILVDVIFKSKGDIYLDTEMHQRLITAEFHGRSLRLVAPEDLLIIKAVAHGELTPGHWHDAIALLSHASIDWDYLIRRAKRAPRRILSLLLYAQSNDIGVPNQVIHDLYAAIFGSRASPRSISSQMPPASLHYLRAAKNSSQMSVRYSIAHLREALAEDPRTHELDIQIEQSEDHVLLRGEVPEPERKAAVERLAKEFLPTCLIENQIRVTQFLEPAETEDIP